jgi:hypothetical protein
MINNFRFYKRNIYSSFILNIIALAVFAAPLHAQQPTAQQIVQSLNLPVSKGKITIYHADGYGKRATEVRPLVEEMMAFYEKRLRVKQDFAVAILTREQWTKSLPPFLPYGLPFVRDNIAFLPATNDGAVTAGAIALKPSATPALLKKIEQTGYDFESAAMKFTDLIGLHELGHVYTLAYGIKPPTRWFNEFLASYFAYAFLKAKHPKLATLMQAMAGDAYIDAVNPKYTTLEDFERFYSNVGVDNYSWYQAKFLQKGVQVYGTQKLEFLSAVKKAFPADEKQQVTQSATLERLEKISPGITQWFKSLK